LALIARWSAFSLSIQAGCQCRVFLISQTIVPHTPQGAVAHLVHEVVAACALRHRHDRIVRKPAGELGLDVDLQHFARALLRALLALAPRLFECRAPILD